LPRASLNFTLFPGEGNWDFTLLPMPPRCVPPHLSSLDIFTKTFLNTNFLRNFRGRAKLKGSSIPSFGISSNNFP
jgi:hypothetical protein